MERFVGTVVFHDGENHLDISLLKGVVDVGLPCSEHRHDALVFVQREFSSNRVQG